MCGWSYRSQELEARRLLGLRLDLPTEVLPLGTCTPPWAGLSASGGQVTPVRVFTAVFPVCPDAQPLGWHPDPYRGNGYPDLSLHLCSYLDTSAP